MKAKENPFRTAKVLRVRYRMRDETPEALLLRLRRLGYRGAIVGSNGTGKTTLLEDLEQPLAALGFKVKHLRLDDRTNTFSREFLKRFFAGLTRNDVILFDGAEQMSLLAWHRFKRRSRNAGGLVITSHRPGMLPTVKECATSPELLDEIINELLDEAVTTRDAAVALHQKHNGNLRDALREMYDLYADMEMRMSGKPRTDSAVDSTPMGRSMRATLRQIEVRNSAAR
jgi:hypothetical protein